MQTIEEGTNDQTYYERANLGVCPRCKGVPPEGRVYCRQCIATLYAQRTRLPIARRCSLCRCSGHNARRCEKFWGASTP
jgi:hypothetical protein